MKVEVAVDELADALAIGSLWHDKSSR